MREVVYFVASSLDAYIADEDGGVDWLFSDQDYGLTPFYEAVDTVVMGRKTYEFGVSMGQTHYEGKQNFVISTTLKQQDCPDVQIAADPLKLLRRLREEDGRRVWLVGGGALFRTALEADLVDRIMLAVHPVLRGSGIPLLPRSSASVDLKLDDVTSYETGLVTLSYAVKRGGPDGAD